MAHPANAAADGNAQLAPCLAAIVPVFNEAPTVGRVIERVLARRYALGGLAGKVRQAGFEIQRIRYFNFAGYFGWWLMFRILKKPRFNPGGVRWFDRIISPPVHWLETNVFPPPLGQSLLVIARAKA